MHSLHPALTALAFIFGGEFLAQVAGIDVGWLAPLVNAGGFGVVCWVLRFFMTDMRQELRLHREEMKAHREELQAVRQAFDESNIAHFHAVLVHKAASEEMRAEMERRIAEIKERAKSGSS